METNDLSIVSCRFCKKTFNAMEKLSKHRCNKKRNKLFSCSICKKHFTDLSVLNEHVLHHPKNKFYKCYFCKKDFKNLIEQQNHIMLHKTGNTNETLLNKFDLIQLSHENDNENDTESVCDKPYRLRSRKLNKKCNLCTDAKSDVCKSTESEDLCRKCKSMGFHCVESGEEHLHKVSHSKKSHTRNVDVKKALKSFNDDKNELTQMKNIKSSTSIPSFPCKLCKNAYDTLHDLIVHMRTHPEYSITCEKCEQNFGSVEEYDSHEIDCVRIETPLKNDEPAIEYSCDICNKTFSSLTESNQHNFICDKLLEQFQTVQDIVALKEACKNCGGDLQEILHLEEDIEKTQENETFSLACADCIDDHDFQSDKIYSCDNCIENIDFIAPKNENTKNDTIPESELQYLLQKCKELQSLSSPKPTVTYKCDTCGENFEYESDLNVHNYIHSGKQIFVCPDCQNGFTDIFQLENHKCDASKEK